MLKQTFYPREDQADTLDRVSKRTGVPKAELIRRALDRYFMNMERTEDAFTIKTAS